MINWYGFLKENNHQLQPIINWLRTEENYMGLTTIDELINELDSPSKRIVLLDKAITPNFYSLAIQLKRLDPNNFVILLTNERNEEDMKQAMRAGITDCITLTDKTEKIIDNLKEIKNHIEFLKKEEAVVSALPQKNGKIITVTSTKGGVGKTTFAVNFAQSILRSKKTVVIVDLHLQFGDVSMFCDLKPKKSIYEWVKEDFDRKNRNVQAYLSSKDEYGLQVMASPFRPEFSEIIKPDHVKELLLELRKWYDFIIIDTHSNVDDILLETMELSNDIFILTNSSLPAVKNTKLFLDTFQSLKLKATTHLIINAMKKGDPLSVEKIKKILDTQPITVIPYEDKLVKASITQGIPFVYSNPKSGLAKRYMRLAKVCIEKQIPIKGKLLAAGGNR